MQYLYRAAAETSILITQNMLAIAACSVLQKAQSHMYTQTMYFVLSIVTDCAGGGGPSAPTEQAPSRSTPTEAAPTGNTPEAVPATPATPANADSPPPTNPASAASPPPQTGKSFFISSS